MIDSIFALKVLLAFVVGGLWITGSTILAEKCGPKIGGLIGGIPATTAIALVFIGWTQSPLVASESAILLPITTGINGLFIVICACLVEFNVILAMVCSLLIWFVLSLGLVIIQFHDFFLSLVSLVILLCFSYLFMEYVLKVRSSHEQSYTFSFSNLILRVLISGSIITLSVVLARFGGPVVGGVFASFPALILSMIIITYLTQGSRLSILPGESRGRVRKKSGEWCKERVLRSME